MTITNYINANINDYIIADDGLLNDDRLYNDLVAIGILDEYSDADADEFDAALEDIAYDFGGTGFYLKWMYNAYEDEREIAEREAYEDRVAYIDAVNAAWRYAKAI